MSPSTAPFAGRDYALYAAIVFLWGTSWIAIRFQLGVVAPEVSLVWRFLIATLVMFAWLVAARQPVRFPVATHLRFMTLGLFTFSSNFLLFYYGGLTAPTGLLAVVFSLTSIVNIALGWLLYRHRPTRRMAVGAVLGVAGVVAMFEPQIAGASFDRTALAGLAMCVVATLSFCIGNMLSGDNQRRGIAVLPANAWGMAYGLLLMTVFSVARGQAFVIEPTLPYVASLAYLAVFSSVLAFACYMTLIGRIGAARTGYSTVMYPVVALALSTLVEGYVWTLPAVAGLALVLAGNLLVLTERPPRPQASATAERNHAAPEVGRPPPPGPVQS